MVGRYNAHNVVDGMPVNPLQAGLYRFGKPPSVVGVLSQPMSLRVQNGTGVGVDSEDLANALVRSSIGKYSHIGMSSKHHRDTRLHARPGIQPSTFQRRNRS